ncbi:ATP-dependent DNA helicase [Paenibacillus marinisediminis]
MKTEKDQIRLSVRALVEYVFRAGSIDTGFRSGNALVEGTKAHQQLQKTYLETDQKEVYVKAIIPYKHLTYVIDGRCDGVLLSEQPIVIDEIKSTLLELDSITEESYPVHWAQATLYAYMYAVEHQQEQMQVQLTYVHAETGTTHRFRKSYSLAELTEFVQDVIQRYSPYAELLHQHQITMEQSMKELTFPFARYREGQRKLAGAVYKTISESNSLFAMAPTGIGKTMSTIFPTLKAIGEGLVKRLFYLTAKTITRTAAEEALSLLQSTGMRAHAVTITAKDKICFKEETICQKDYCEFANGYYDRLNGAILDILEHETLMSRTVIEQYARKHRICPFEFALDTAYASDIMIGDYNYVFDPRVSLKRLQDESKRSSVLLIDEAHNLVDRGREMFSATVIKSAFLQLKRAYKELNRGLYETAHAVNQYMIGIRKRCEHGQAQVWNELERDLNQLLEAFVLSAEQELANGNRNQGARSGQVEDDTIEQARSLLLDTYFTAQSFIRIAEWYDERYVTYAELDKNDVAVKLFCVDPSNALAQMRAGYRSSIFFSATLSPLHYYRDMLGASEENYTVTIPSPFSKEQLDVRIIPLSTRYKDREQTRDALIQLIADLAQEQPGNYLVFFPSYQYLQDVYTQFAEQNPSIHTIVQETGMSEEAREGFLDAFQADRSQTLIGFTVLGGIFSEGIDLVGDRLNRVIVVGVGLPQLCLERDIMKQQFNNDGKNGYDYAYVYPGMNKVLQAGGRLIRSEQDTGLLVLVDDRFISHPYNQLLPPTWKE